MRLCAAWLIVLIAVPFTPPFQTLDLRATGGIQVADTVVSEKLPQDAAVAALPQTLFTEAVITMVLVSESVERPVGGRVLPTVLRL
jgi:hypothetical protein